MPDTASTFPPGAGGAAKPAFDYSHRNIRPIHAFNSYAVLLRKQAVELVKNAGHTLKPKTVILIILAVAIIAFFGKNIKDIILVAVLGIAASYSTIYKRTIRVPSAVELVTLGTVITGAAYGPLWGVLFGVLTTFASEIISSGIDVFTLFYAISRGLAGGLSQFLVGTFNINVVAMGMIALLIFHAISDAIYILSGDVEAKLKVVYFLIVNTLFNFMMFTLFGNLLLSLARL